MLGVNSAGRPGQLAPKREVPPNGYMIIESQGKLLLVPPRIGAIIDPCNDDTPLELSGLLFFPRTPLSCLANQGG